MLSVTGNQNVQRPQGKKVIVKVGPDPFIMAFVK